ncbi:MAG: DUF2298 domain-containing protein [Candidatus Dojkabacteria bacterium]|nr:DUF2298 domain-containing protein [Candidatus Dojkabacteria bacterium]
MPILRSIFPNWRDKVYIFSKLVGLILISWITWFLTNLEVLSFTKANVVLVTLVLLVISIYFIVKLKIRISKTIIFLEILFLTTLFFTTVLRSANPRLEGTEKMMDAGIMYAINRSEKFPPLDTWLSGYTINYYYFGHYIYTFVSKLTGIPIEFAYNLSISTIFTFVFLSFFTIVWSLLDCLIITKILYRFLSLCFSLGISIVYIFGGNLDFIRKFFVSILFNKNFSYFYPEGTRLIPFTINEFPLYSFLVGDLHGHYISLPFFIIAVGICIYIFTYVRSYVQLFFYSFVIGVFAFWVYMINSWDTVTLIMIVFFMSLTKLVQINKLTLQVFVKDIQKLFSLCITLFLQLTNVLLAFVLAGIFVVIPFLLHFTAPIDGIGFKYGGSRLYDIFIIFGGFLVVIFIFFLLKFLLSSFTMKNKLFTVKNKSIYLLLFIGFSLIIFVEFVYVKDIFYLANEPYYRANTVFKFYYHVWIILGVVASYMSFVIFKDLFVFLLNKQIRINKRIYFVLTVFVYNVLIINFLALMLYGIRGILDAYPIQNNNFEMTLDGTRFMQKEYIGDYYAILFLNKEIKKQPVIVEAVGEAYTYYSRVSTFTGLPTIVGWPTHEWQWRKNSSIPFARAEQVQKFYESVDMEDVINFIRTYNVKYIYIGSLEKQKYNVNYANIEKVSKKIYDSFDTMIYQVII